MKNHGILDFLSVGLRKLKLKESLWDCVPLFHKNGLLLWLAYAQHVHYDRICERKSETKGNGIRIGVIMMANHYA